MVSAQGYRDVMRSLSPCAIARWLTSSNFSMMLFCFLSEVLLDAASSSATTRSTSLMLLTQTSEH